MGGKRPDQYRIALGEAGASDYKFRADEETIGRQERRSRLSAARLQAKQPVPASSLKPKRPARGRRKGAGEPGGAEPAVLDIATRAVVTLAPTDSLRDALELLLEHRIGGAPVVASDHVIGVLSASDILAFNSTEREAPLGPVAGDWQAWLDAEAFEGEDVAAPFFMDADGTVDLLAERVSALTAEEQDVLADTGVGDAMTRRVVALPPDTPVSVAAARMLQAGVHRVLLMDGQRLVGVVSATDFVRVVAERGLKG